MTRPRLRKRSGVADGSENLGLRSQQNYRITEARRATTETANEETNPLNGDATSTLSFPAAANNRRDLEFCSRTERKT